MFQQIIEICLSLGCIIKGGLLVDHAAVVHGQRLYNLEVDPKSMFNSYPLAFAST